VQVSDLKVGDLIKCTHADGNQGVEGERTHSFGVIVKLERPQRRNRNRPNEEQITWAEIHWHEGNRTWEEMEVSLETCFEVMK